MLEVQRLSEAAEAVGGAKFNVSQSDIKSPRMQGEDDELEFERLLEEIQGTNVRTEVIIRLLGIQNCVDTVVGNAYIRGVSGGERKRVTSAEMLVGPKVLFQSIPNAAEPSFTVSQAL